MQINVARTVPRSAVNGPGERFVVWVQGCPLHCPGCWNPDTWSFARRQLRTVGDLAHEIRTVGGIEGVTFTGGEPFAQARALAALGRQLVAADMSVFVFSGYELNELTEPAHRELLAVTDVLVAGRYIEAKRTLMLPWRGSANQSVHFLTGRYSECVAEATAGSCEVHIDSEGTATVTGFPERALFETRATSMGATPQ